MFQACCHRFGRLPNRLQLVHSYVIQSDHMGK
nr:MAG TPA: hypothetical protein [Caudoviricetes sp.]